MVKICTSSKLMIMNGELMRVGDEVASLINSYPRLTTFTGLVVKTKNFKDLQ